MNPLSNPAIRKRSLYGWLVGICVCLSANVSIAKSPNIKSPNLLLIMADDVGIEGFGCYGGASYQTPNIDQLAASGVRFTHAYAQPLCTPTRVQLMTGKYNHRNWSAFGILDPSAKTIGHYLQDAGYKTGIFGKWQLYSYDPPDFPGADQRRSTGMHPKDAGFDEYSMYHAGHTEDKGSRYANPTILRGLESQDGELSMSNGRYGPDVWTQEIISFFDRHREVPKFVYYPMALPHRPFEPTPKTPGWDQYGKGKVEVAYGGDELSYASDMIEYVDVVVGRLITALREQRQLEETIIIFYSDNGTHTSVTSKMADGREIQGGKATTLQTGIHVPLIVSRPGHIQPRVCSDLIDASDFLPTLVELAGGTFAKEDSMDGQSFASSLRGESSTKREAAFFWYDPRPGWDKTRFDRHVFALDHGHKLFRDGRLFRLGPRPLEETFVAKDQWNDEDQKARDRLARAMKNRLDGSVEPVLVDAFGNPL